jgi:hypothetical protein
MIEEGKGVVPSVYDAMAKNSPPAPGTGSSPK